jgi:tRNA threonylcarbamoyl adenosine modification protein YeaZ
VGLVVDDQVLAFQSNSDSMQHVEQLSPTIDQVLQTAGLAFEDVSLIAVNRGPSPYTGLRVGLAAAKAMSLALSIPAVGVSCLEVEYQLAAQRYAESNVLVAEDARRKQVYYSYNGESPDIDYPENLVAKFVSHIDDRLEEGYSAIPLFRYTIYKETAQINHDATAKPTSLSTVVGAKSWETSQPAGDIPLIVAGTGVSKYSQVFSQLPAQQYLPTQLSEPESARIYAAIAQNQAVSKSSRENDLSPLYLRRPDVQPQ